MPVPEVTQSFTSSVNQVTLGSTKENGGTRTSTVTVGGSRNVVYGGSMDDAGNKPVIAYQEVGFKLAEMLTLTQTAQLMAYKAAWLAETGDREALTVTDCAKVFCAESADEVAGSALRILSAAGLAPNNPADIACRYAKFIQIAGTSTEIARVRIGDSMLKSS